MNKPVEPFKKNISHNNPKDFAPEYVGTILKGLSAISVPYTAPHTTYTIFWHCLKITPPPSFLPGSELFCFSRKEWQSFGIPKNAIQYSAMQ